MKRKISLILITVSCFLFGSASVVPIFSVEPAAGEWTAIAQLLSPADMKTMNFSLIEGVKTLLWDEFILSIGIVIKIDVKRLLARILEENR